MSDPQLSSLIRRGQKIAAIHRLREQTGMGLAEAKAEVERLAAGGAASTAETSEPVAAGDTRFVDGDIRVIAEQGRRIEAIRLLRQRRGIGLRDAKLALDAALPPTPIRRARWAWAAIIAVALAAWFLLHR